MNVRMYFDVRFDESPSQSDTALVPSSISNVGLNACHACRFILSANIFLEYCEGSGYSSCVTIAITLIIAEKMESRAFC